MGVDSEKYFKFGCGVLEKISDGSLAFKNLRLMGGQTLAFSTGQVALSLVHTRWMLKD